MYRFERLYRNLYNPAFYTLAYVNIYANKGSMTPGVDGTTMDGMSIQRIERIIASVKDRSYQPNPARRKYIAKENSDKKRPLGIPSGDDKLVQEVIRMILESIYEPTFRESSHGFRPRKSCHTALLKIQATFTGAKWFVEGDIKACFDSFDHHVLIDLLRKRINDEAFIALMWKFLKAGYMEQWEYHKTYSGVPQGSGMSPVLANIYLHELDKHMEEYKANFDRSDRRANPAHRNLACKIHRIKRQNAKTWDTLSESERKERAKTLRQMRAEQRELPARPVREDGYKSLQYVRYADDFIIGVIGGKEDAEDIKRDLATFLNDKLRLTLSGEKTAVTHTAENARFLGYDITVSRSRDIKRKKDGSRSRVYSGVVKLHMPHEKWAAKLLELGAIRIRKDKITGKEHWQAIHRRKLINLNDIGILSKVNSEVRGFYNYYSVACNASTLNHFSSLMKYSMLKTFGAKYRCQVRKIKERYVKNGDFTVSYETKSGMKEAVYYNKGFHWKKTPLLGQVDAMDAYRQYDKPNSLAARLRGRTCELCGAKTDSIEVHEVKRLKDLKGQTEWEIEMRRHRRKTLAVCHECHERIHSL
jgi:group II intron reverse transcriptase/maturase